MSTPSNSDPAPRQELQPTFVEVSDGRVTWRIPAGLRLLTPTVRRFKQVAIEAARLRIHLYYHYNPSYLVALRPDGTLSKEYGTAAQMLAYLEGVEHRASHPKPNQDLVTGVE